MGLMLLLALSTQTAIGQTHGWGWGGLIFTGLQAIGLVLLPLIIGATLLIIVILTIFFKTPYWLKVLGIVIVAAYFASMIFVPRRIESDFYASCKTDLRTNLYAKSVHRVRGIITSVNRQTMASQFTINAGALVHNEKGFPFSKDEYGRIFSWSDHYKPIPSDRTLEIRQTLTEKKSTALYAIVQRYIQIIDSESGQILADTTSYHLTGPSSGSETKNFLTNLWQPNIQHCGYKMLDSIRQYPNDLPRSMGHQALMLTRLVAVPM